MILYKIQRNKLVVALLYFVIFTLLLHSTVKVIENNVKITNYAMVSSGCKLEKITITGNKVIDANQIKNELIHLINSNTFVVSLNKIKKIVEKNPWCKKVIVKRKLPNEIIIQIEEKKPFAALLKEKSIVDSNFNKITNYKDGTYSNLNILLINESDFASTKEIAENLKQFPEILKDIKYINNISNRRWDIITFNNVLIKLPEENIKNALSKLEKLNQEKTIFSNKEIKTIDLRTPEKLFIEYYS